MIDTTSEILIFDSKLKAERDYWLERVAALDTTAGLPPDYQRNGPAPSETARVEILLPRELAGSVSALAGDSPFLVYTILMAAIKVCLYKYTTHNFITVGSPALKELGKANALAITDHLDSEMSFQELLLKVRESLLSAYAHQHYPFSRLLRDLHRENGARECPLFEVALTLTNIHGPLPDTRHDLTITLTKSADDISGHVEFNRELFKQETIERFAQHFINILRTGVAEKKQRLREFELTAGSEREQLIYGWNRTLKDYPHEASLPRLFEAQVKQTPLNAAVKFAGNVLTYDDLNTKANQLARHLRTLGVGPDVLVGLHLERSFELVIAILAVLKAGGAYVPLDLMYPKERLAFMLEDAGLKVLLTQQRLVENLPHHLAQLVLLDSLNSFANEAGQDLDVDVSGDNLAYVMYTSGSTGRPKGVMISNRGLSNYLSWATKTYRVAAGEGAPVHSPLGFDLTVTSLCTPLLAGKCVMLRDEEGVEGLLTTLRDGNDFSLVKLTPAHLEVLKQLPNAAQAAERARLFVVGGEALYAESLCFWREHNPEVRIINEYGPTETVVGCCVYEVPFGSLTAGAVPIGHPIDNTQLYVLDPHMKPLPLGIAGELYIGGIGLARGYLRRPGLTAERFVPDSFGEQRGARLYRTGDLVRARSDGTLEFIGRCDRQVKVRGFRIELGEVESTLLRLPLVREAVVALEENARGDTSLVAYVVGEGKITAEEIRESLQTELPAYMLPSEVVLLDRLPLTTHGKVDQQQLRTLAAAAKRGNAADGSAPVTEVEQSVAEIWSEVLGVKSVARETNFFDLGGHSLLATQVMARVRERLQVEIPLQKLFESPTVAQFAAQIEANRLTNRRPVDSIERISRAGELPLSFAQERFWYLNSLHSGTSAYNSCGLVRVTGPLNVVALEQAINEIIRRHEALRTIFVEADGRPVQIIAPPYSITLLLADVSGLSANKAAAIQQQLTNAEIGRPFDLSTGPLLRVNVIRSGEYEHLVQVTMHHIVTDGWSNDLFYKELVSLYTSYSDGQPSPLKTPAVQYVDFAHWQRAQLQGAQLSAQRAYWQQQLANAPTPPSLSDRPLPALSPRIARTHYFSLGHSLADRLQQFTRAQSVTLYAALMAGFAALLHLYTSAEDIIVGTPVSNRNRKETEAMIGCLINTLALRVNLKGNPNFVNLARQVQDTILAGHANQDIPFEVVAESLTARTGKRTALFRHWFVLLQAVETLKLDEVHGLKWTVEEEVESASAQFELTMLVHQVGGALDCTLVYAAGELETEAVETFAADYEAVLAAALDEPDAGILELTWTDRVAQQAQVQVI